MLDIENIVTRFRQAYGDHKQLILAAPFELSPILSAKLISKGIVDCYVAECADERDGPNVQGFWKDRSTGSWQLRPSWNGTIIYLGERRQVGSRMLFSAARAGITKIYACEQDEFHLLGVWANCGPRLIESAKNRRITKQLRYGRRTYEQAFRELAEIVGDSFKVDFPATPNKKLAIIIGTLGPGGAERQAALTSLGLHERGWNSVIVATSSLQDENGFHRQKIEAGGVSVVELPITPSDFEENSDFQRVLEWSRNYVHLGFQNITHVILSYVSFFRNTKPDVAQMWMDYTNVLAGIAAEFVGIPKVVLSCRSVAPHNFAIFQPYMKPGYQFLIESSNVEITNNSNSGARSYANWLELAPESIPVIKNGFTFPDPLPDKSEAKKSFSLSNEVLVVGSIIRFSEEKQPYLWIETAQKILTQQPATKFLLAGDGVMHQEIKNHVLEQGLEHSIILPGLVTNAWQALCAMDVFLMTSRMEGLPNVVIEAQAVGLPVVTTARGGMVECYIENVTGFSAKNLDASELANLVTNLLVNANLRKQMAQDAFLHSRNTFSLDRMLDDTERVLQANTASLLIANG